MSVTIPAGPLARGWLSVRTASVKDAGRPQLDRSIYIEQFGQGLRLTAADSYLLLSAWVPALHHELEAAPSDDEIPYAAAVALDPYGRAAGLLGHMLALWKSDEAKTVDLNLVVHLNVPWQPAEIPSAELQLDGFAALAVTIEHPDHERVQLEVYEGDYPDTRRLFASHKPGRPDVLALTGHMLARLGKAAKVHGDGTVVHHRFGGALKPVLVTFGEEPEVRGLAMPCAWDLARDAPAVSAREVGDEVCVP